MFYGKWGLESIQHRINPGHLSGGEALNRENERLLSWTGYISPGGRGTPGDSRWGVCRPDLQILTLFQTNLKCHFPHPFSDLEEITNRNMFTKTEIISSLLRLERRQKDFLKFILNSHTSCGVISYSFGTIRQICSYATVAPSKTIPVFRPKRRKTLPFWAAHTYMGYLREYPHPRDYIAINGTLARVRRP